MTSRLDAVLAAGMARLSVAPEPTGAIGGSVFSKEVHDSIDSGVAQLWQMEQSSSMTDRQVKDAVKAIVETVARQHNIPDDLQVKLRNAVNNKRRYLKTRDRSSAPGAAIPSAPAPLKRELSDSKYERENPKARLKEAESDLARLLGPPPTEADKVEYIYLTNYGRQRVFEYLGDPKRKDALQTLARDLEMSMEQAARVIRSEQKRIARIVDRERKTLAKLGPEAYEAVNTYADAQETPAPPAMAAVRSEGLLQMQKEYATKLRMNTNVFKKLVMDEMGRRKVARAEREEVIHMAPGERVFYHSESAPRRSRVLPPYSKDFTLSTEQEAALRQWAKTTGSREDRTPWNDKVDSLQALALQYQIPWRAANDYMKVYTHSNTGFRAKGGYGWVPGDRGAVLSPKDIETVLSPDYQRVLEREDANAKALEALEEHEDQFVDYVLTNPGVVGPAWLNEILNQWDAENDEDAVLAGDGEVELPRTILDNDEDTFDALDLLLFADEASL